MIDTRLLSEDFEETARRLARKRVSSELLVGARELVLERRSAVRRLDDARREANLGATEVGRLMREGREDEALEQRRRLGALRTEVGALEAALGAVQSRLDEVLARIPNIPDDAVPDGDSESDNRVVRTCGYDPAAYAGKVWLPHWEVASRWGTFDAERAAKLSGGMFSLLKGDGARLLRALVDLGLDLNRDRYEEVAPPHLVRTEVIERTGHLTKFDTQAYRLRDDELWLVPTGEVPLMGMHQDEIIAGEDLPVRYMAATVCWRREAGAAGKDTRGMQRLHEFRKVELVSLTTPEESQAELGAILGDAERSLQALELPYRVVELCAGDLTFSSSRVFDLEVYAPGVDRWLEAASISLITDFQARRGAIRFRRPGGATELVHSLNGSGLATPRVWAALVENGQQPDGSIRLPEVLGPYMGKTVIGN